MSKNGGREGTTRQAVDSGERRATPWVEISGCQEQGDYPEIRAPVIEDPLGRVNGQQIHHIGKTPPKTEDGHMEGYLDNIKTDAGKLDPDMGKGQQQTPNQEEVRQPVTSPMNGQGEAHDV